MNLLRNNRGIALMIAISALMLILYLVMEITYDSTVEYTVNSQNLNRIKAYYAAKSGMELSLLRIKIYQQARDQFGEQLGANASMLDEIWKFPFAWPLPPMEGMNAVDSDKLEELNKASSMDAAYIVTIEDEGSKIDLNDLASSSKKIAEATRKQLLRIFETKMEQDRDFERRMGNYRPADIIDNITDFVSSSRDSASGRGGKTTAFAELNRLAGSEIFPPNRAFRSLAELRFIPGINDEIFALLEPRVTVFGMKGINPNLANKDTLMSLDSGMTEEVVSEIMKRRDDPNLGGPFKNAEDFWAYVNQSGGRMNGNPEEIPLIFDNITNFRIRSTGEFAGASREITAIVMDVDRVAQKVARQLVEEKAEAEGKKAPEASKNKAANTQTKGPPRIVYWDEK
ncbi:MAG: general secretion pathway protein GspK [Bdellovibrionia bacterium]